MSSNFVVLADDAHRAHDGRFGAGYPEIPARADAIRHSLQTHGLQIEETHSEPREAIIELHAEPMLQYLADLCSSIEPGGAIYPPVAPGAILDGSGHPHARTFCFDLSTPLTHRTPEAALAAAGLALEGAERILSGSRFVYALCRPPGHHAGIDFFGGFCYLNNAALAADALAARGSVAILDLDYHHGNGTQQIFFERADVLYVSIHADPTFAYPQISGYADEVGRNEGKGFNSNFPMPQDTGDPAFLDVLPKAVDRVSNFEPDRLVLSLGCDGAAGDPLGTWSLSQETYARAGAAVADLNTPTLIVQEGGYNLTRLGDDVFAFLSGMGFGS